MRRNTVHRRYTARRPYKRNRRLRQILSLLVVVLTISGAIFLTYAKKEPDPQQNLFRPVRSYEPSPFDRGGQEEVAAHG